MEGRNARMIRRFYPGYQSPKVSYQQLLDQQALETSAGGASVVHDDARAVVHEIDRQHC